MDVNNLPKQLINVIALKLSGSVGHPLFKYKECQSDYFPCLTGVRQGENLSLFYSQFF
jgi:hypothetical protein